AEMKWMTNDWIDRSSDPRHFVEGCRSVVVVGLTAARQSPPAIDGGVTRGRVARYAWGRDYHRVFEPRLKKLATAFRGEFGGRTRTAVDYGPLLERSVAALAGVGWIGKSTMLLVPGLGPWAMLGAVATTVDIEPDEVLRKSCGSCTRCVVACPTKALGVSGGEVDSRLCLSYQTIENRGPIPADLREAMADRVFGCDACLDSCPVGAGASASEPAFAAGDEAAARPPLVELLLLDGDSFRDKFRGRAIRRTGRDGLVRNACVALGNCGLAGELPPLLRALEDPSALVRSHAAWAVGRMVERLGLDPSKARDSLQAALHAETDGATRVEMADALATLPS
ncbi:MAG: tRNA epoxyqueuosine(34) reductase QueG, partial [Dehalococcoidia bacterium]